jgi:hypothetical protein
MFESEDKSMATQDRVQDLDSSEEKILGLRLFVRLHQPISAIWSLSRVRGIGSSEGSYLPFHTGFRFSSHA